MRSFYVVVILFITSFLNAQSFNLCKYTEGNVSASHIINSLPNDDNIIEMVNSIKNIIEVPDTFITVNSPGFNNCAAMIYYGKKLIIYDPEFLYHISNGQKHIMISIIAHEIGHHLLGHTASVETKNMHKIEDKLEVQRKRELEADYFSGIIMEKLGYSLNQALEGVSKLADHYDDAYFTHPLKEKRNLVITETFERSVKKLKVKNSKLEEYFGNEGDPESYINRVLKYSKSESIKNIEYKNYQRGQDLYKDGKYKEALIELNKLTKTNDLYTIFAKVIKIDIYRQLGNEYKALEVSLSLEQEDFVKRFDYPMFLANYVYFNIAGSYELLGNNLKALEYFNKVYKLLPDDKITKAKIGILNFEMGNYYLATKYLDDSSLEKEYHENNFSPNLYNKLFNARLKSFEKSKEPRKKIIDAYLNVIVNHKNYLWDDDNLVYYLLNFTNFLINDLEKNYYYENENIIYGIFKYYYKTLESVSSENANIYIRNLIDFYQRNKTRFDVDSQKINEINSQNK